MSRSLFWGQVTDVRGWFNDNVSDELLKATVEKVLGGNRDAAIGISSNVKDGTYTRSVAKDLFPHIRRARIESCLFGLESEFPSISVQSLLNSTKSHYHTRIRSGNVILTASSVLTPRGLVREAEFRNHYASAQFKFDINQYGTLSPVTLELASSDELLYGIILYCPAEGNRFEIGSIHLGFPNQDCTGYVDCVDLMKVFPNALKRTEVEEIQDQAIVKLLLEQAEAFLPGRDREAK